MAFGPKKVAGVVLVALSLVLVYRQVLVRLVDAWTNDGNYSHGFFILPLAAYFAWTRRDQLRATPLEPAWSGLLVLGAGLVLLLGGLYGAELFLSRISFVVTLTGVILFLFGWSYLRVLWFPLAFLLLMIPIPAIIFNQIAFPLQL